MNKPEQVSITELVMKLTATDQNVRWLQCHTGASDYKTIREFVEPTYDRLTAELANRGFGESAEYFQRLKSKW